MIRFPCPGRTDPTHSFKIPEELRVDAIREKAILENYRYMVGLAGISKDRNDDTIKSRLFSQERIGSEIIEELCKN